MQLMLDVRLLPLPRTLVICQRAAAHSLVSPPRYTIHFDSIHIKYIILCWFKYNKKNIFKMSLCEVLEPLDYEEFLAQHQPVLDRDPLKSILDFPPGDVELTVVNRKIRTEEPIVPHESL